MDRAGRRGRRGDVHPPLGARGDLEGDGGERVHLGDLGPGDFFGEMAVLESLPRAVTELAPFLNVHSGGRLTRIEPGHLYDPWYCRSPRSYTAATRLAGYALIMVPDVYRLYSRAERGLRSLRVSQAQRHGVTDYEALSPYRLAAEALIERGFDTVVFGHTHDAERVEIAGGLYLNGGSWLRGDTYVELCDGVAELKHWGTGA